MIIKKNIYIKNNLYYYKGNPFTGEFYFKPSKFSEKQHYFTVNGLLHKEDGPALINNFESKWYKNGKLHRDGGPALINNCIQEWYKNGKLHREDGFAIETKYKSYCFYYFNGQKIITSSLDEFKKIIKLLVFK